MSRDAVQDQATLLAKASLRDIMQDAALQSQLGDMLAAVFASARVQAAVNAGVAAIADDGPTVQRLQGLVVDVLQSPATAKAAGDLVLQVLADPRTRGFAVTFLKGVVGDEALQASAWAATRAAVSSGLGLRFLRP